MTINPKFNLSFILPAIRHLNWDMLYESALASCKRHTFEMIFCGPFPLTPKLQKLPNVKYIKDMGSPSRAQNIAGMFIEGELMTWIADDGPLLEDAMDKNIDMLRTLGPSHKNIVVIKYFEGKDGTEKGIQPDSYFYLGNTVVMNTYVPPNWIMCTSPLMYTDFYYELGGIDSTFEVCPMAHIDFGIRAMMRGANIVLSSVQHQNLNHMGHGEGDHAAVEIGQINYDQPKIREKYLNPNWPQNNHQLPIDNWKLAPTIWRRRFHDGKVPQNYQAILDSNAATYER